jgi:hypothetical protein
VPAVASPLTVIKESSLIKESVLDLRPAFRHS